MPIVSYAQNFEDVLLWRALKGVDRGFYVDIGAQDPIVDSVSKAFYEQGWRGIHVEPTSHYSELLRRDRPDEIVHQVAIGRKHGLLRFYEIPESGLSTARQDIAEKHRKAGWTVRELTVPEITLDELLETVPAIEIHWMKIDVEGFEHEVLAGWRRSQHRPWIIVIESTYPTEKRQTYQAWQKHLLSKGYVYGFTDGINRYYVHGAHKNLRIALQHGPNIFDAFQMSGTAWAVHQIQDDHIRASKAADTKLAEISARLEVAKTRAEEEIRRQRVELETKRSDLQGVAISLEGAKTQLDGRLTRVSEQVRGVADSIVDLRDEALSRAAEQTKRIADESNVLLSEFSALRTAQSEERTEFFERLGANFIAEAERHDRTLEGIATLEHRVQSLEELATKELQSARTERDRLQDLLRHAIARSSDREALLSGLAQQTIEKLDQTTRRHVIEMASREARFAETAMLIRTEGQREREALVTAFDHRVLEQGLLFDFQIRAASERFEKLSNEADRKTGELVSQKWDLERQLREESKECDDLRLKLQEYTGRHGKMQLLLGKLEGENAALRQALDLLSSELAHLKRSIPYRWLRFLHRPLDRSQTVGARQSAEASGCLEIAAPAQAGAPEFPRDTRWADGPSAATGSTAEPPSGEQYPVTVISPSETIAAMSDPYSINDVQDLLALDDAAFVEAAYVSLLGRSPDASGMNFYLGRLRAGLGKRLIVSEIGTSTEARERRTEIRGLAELLAEERRRGHWLFGNSTRLARLERRCNVIENELGRARTRLAAIDRELSGRQTAVRESPDQSRIGADVSAVAAGFHRSVIDSGAAFWAIRDAITSAIKQRAE